MKKKEVLALLRKTGLDIKNFNSLPGGDNGLLTLFLSKVDASKKLPFLFSEPVSVEVRGGVSEDKQTVLIIVEYGYHHFNGGSNGKNVHLRSTDGGVSFEIW